MRFNEKYRKDICDKIKLIRKLTYNDYDLLKDINFILSFNIDDEDTKKIREVKINLERKKKTG